MTSRSRTRTWRPTGDVANGMDRGMAADADFGEEERQRPHEAVEVGDSVGRGSSDGGEFPRTFGLG